jgi:hypothetical protein
MYCQNAAANVLDRDGKVRYDYTELKESLAAVTDNVGEVDPAVMNLHEKIVQLCNNKCQHAECSNQSALILTLLNIHAAYLMISGLWKEETNTRPKEDEYGFEIF